MFTTLVISYFDNTSEDKRDKNNAGFNMTSLSYTQTTTEQKGRILHVFINLADGPGIKLAERTNHS